MMVALLLALSTPAEIAAWDGLPIPDAIGVPAANYITCISSGTLDDIAAGTTSAANDRRQAMDLTLEDCRHERTQAAEAMNARMAQVPGWTDPEIRAAKVERILSSAERRVGFIATNPAGFQAMVAAMRQCRAAGDNNCEDKAAAHLPAQSKAN
jgi:hypothetical protein